MDSPDVLSTLRQAIKSKFDITFSNSEQQCPSLSAATHLVLPSGPILKSAETRYAKAGTTASSPQDFYTAEALYLAWSLRDAAVADYMKQTRENGLTTGYVSITERKTVVDWLEGRIPDHDRIRPAQGERSHNISKWYLCMVSGVYNSTRFTAPKPSCISIYDPKVSSG